MDQDPTTSLRCRLVGHRSWRRSTLVWCTLVALVLTAGCTASREPSTSAPPGSSSRPSAAGATDGPRPTVHEMAKAVCGGKPVITIGPEETERSTSAPGASCGDTDIRLFRRPSGRKAWVSIARESAPVLVGSDWAVASRRRVLSLGQRELGGEIVLPRLRTGIMDTNEDRIDDQAFDGTDCSVAFSGDDRQGLRRDCLANGGH
jgi:hypothetical protein